MEELTQIVNLLEKIETNNLNEDPETKKWINEITDPEFGFVSSCSELLIENIQNAKVSREIILVLRKMFFYNPDKVLPQMEKSKDFLNGMLKYLTNIKAEESTPEILVLLNAFSFNSNNNFHLNLPEEIVLNEQFNQSIINYLGNVSNEETMNMLIKLVSYMHYNQNCYQLNLKISSNEQNVEHSIQNISKILENSKNKSNNEKLDKMHTLKFLKGHNKFKLALECFIRILVNNSFEKEDTLYVMMLLIDLMNYTSSSLFFTADIESLIDFALKRLESTSTEIIRDLVLVLTERATFYPGYNKSNYKKANLEDLMDNYIDSDIINDRQKDICDEILKNVSK